MSSMHKKLDTLKAEVMRISTLVAVEEQVAAMYRGVMLAEIITPSGDGRLEEYHAVVMELLTTTQQRVVVLRQLAQTGAEQGPLRQVAREIEKLESMMADPKRTQKPS